MKAIRVPALGLVLLCALAAFGREPESFEGLKTRCNSASPQEQPRSCVDVAKFQLRAADEFVKAGNGQQAHAAVDDVVTYATKAADASTKTGKRLKDTEIELRKLAEKLRSLKRNADFEDQAPIQKATDQIEGLRTELLSRMFGKKAK